MNPISPVAEPDQARARVMASMILAALIPAWFNATLLALVLSGFGMSLSNGPPWQFVTAAVLLAWQIVLAWRLHLDERLFQAFAANQLQPATLDSVLAELSIRPASSEPRDMLDRLRGARGLIRQQALLSLISLGLLLLIRLLAAPFAHA